MTPELDLDERATVVLADGRGAPGRGDDPTRRVFARMAVGTGVTLATLVVAGWFASVQLAEREVLGNVRDMNEVFTHALVEPVSDRLLVGDPDALAVLDDAVRAHLLPDTPVERVKLWDGDGRIVYSDEQDLVGQRFPLSGDQLEVLRTRESSTEVSDLSADENRLERGEGTRLLEVYSAAVTDSGEVLLVESYVRYDVLQQREREVMASVTGVGLLGLGLFAVSQLWLASANLRWLQRERARLAQHGAEIVEEQRRQMARDLHDGVVQDLVGAAYLVNGGAARLRAVDRADAAEALHGAEVSIRTSIRSLRSLLVDLHPPTLQSSGLRAALTDLVAPLQARGVDVRLDLPEDLGLPEHLEATLHRAAQEALRNAARNGRATEITVCIRRLADSVELTVRDDGTGFDPTRPLPDGHLGLRGLADEAATLGGMLEVTSAPGRGTSLRLVLPR